MPFGSNLLFFFSALGAFNGLMAGIFFVFNRSSRTLSRYFLGALLLALSIRVAKSVAYFFDYSLSRTILQIGLTACVFIGPLLYFFVRTEPRQVRRLPASWMRQLIAWAFVIVVVGVFFPYKSFPHLWRHYIIYSIYLQWAAYIVLTAALLTPVFKRIASKEKLKPFEYWTLTIFIAVTAVFCAYAWSFTGITPGSYIAGPLCFSVIVYSVISVLLFRKKTTDLSSLSSQKYGNKKLDERETESTITKLRLAMTGKELFRNPQLKLADLAREVDIPEHQLSRILNDSLQKNFTLFVNEYRVNAACEELTSPNNLTIEAIGEDVGFNSKSTFFATFKKIKGLTPNAYMQKTTPDL